MPSMPSTTNSKRKNNNGLATKQIFTTGEAAQACNVSQQTIIRCFDNDSLKGYRVPGSRFRRIPRAELIRFMKANDIPTDLLEGSRRRLLVIDDNPEILRFVPELIGDDDRFEVKTASKPFEAGLLIEEFKPHLILLDYMLPGLDGNVVCTRIRQKPYLADTKIVIVSGVENRDEIEGLMRSGANEFIRKPFRMEGLLKMIERLLDIVA